MCMHMYMCMYMHMYMHMSTTLHDMFSFFEGRPVDAP